MGQGHGNGGGAARPQTQGPGRRDLGQNPKLSCRGSVTGVLRERAVGSGVRWWVWAKGTETAGGLRVRKRKAQVRSLGQNPKLSCRGSVTGVPCETAVGSSGVRWWVGAKGTETAGGLHVRKREVGGQGLGQNPKPSRRGSVTGVPCETAVGSGGVRWWVGPRARKRRGGCAFANARPGCGVWVKPETEPSWLSYGCAV